MKDLKNAPDAEEEAIRGKQDWYCEI